MLQNMKTFINVHKKAIILNVIVVFVCYVHMIFSMNMGIDTEIMISNGPEMLKSWTWIGRHGLVLTKTLLNLRVYNPYFAGIIFLAAFMALGIFTAFYCWLAAGKNDRYPYGLFLALFSTCPVWMMQFYFALQRMEVVLGLVYTLISVFCFNQFVFYQKKNIYLLAYLVFGVWGFCSYQGNVMFYIGLCVMFLILDFAEHYQQKQWQDYSRMILKLTGGFLVIYLVNMVIIRLFFGQGVYLREQVAWGKVGISEIIYRICAHVHHILFFRGTWFRSAYPLACLCVAAVFIMFCQKKEMKKGMKGILFLAMAGLLITPVLLTIYIGNIPVPRSQFALQLISAFACMFACGIWKMDEDRKVKFLFWDGIIQRKIPSVLPDVSLDL